MPIQQRTKHFFRAKRRIDQTFAPIFCYIIILHSHEKYNPILLYTNILENEAKRQFTGMHMFTKFSFDSTNLFTTKRSVNKGTHLVSP